MHDCVPADEQGLGKTVQMLSLICSKGPTPFEAKKALRDAEQGAKNMELHVLVMTLALSCEWIASAICSTRLYKYAKLSVDQLLAETTHGMLAALCSGSNSCPATTSLAIRLGAAYATGGLLPTSA